VESRARRSSIMVRKRWIARLSEIAQNPAKTRASSDSLKGVGGPSAAAHQTGIPVFPQQKTETR
jgi:hypothetical protein